MSYKEITVKLKFSQKTIDEFVDGFLKNYLIDRVDYEALELMFIDKNTLDKNLKILREEIKLMPEFWKSLEENILSNGQYIVHYQEYNDMDTLVNSPQWQSMMSCMQCLTSVVQDVKRAQDNEDTYAQAIRLLQNAGYAITKI